MFGHTIANSIFLISALTKAVPVSFFSQPGNLLITNPTDEESKIEKIVKDKSKLLNLNKEVLVKFNDSEGAEAHGLNITNLPCGITVGQSNKLILNSDAEGFIVAHELSHIKNNDFISIPVGSFLISEISSLGLSILIPNYGFTNYVVSSLIGSVAYIIISKFCESQADKDALSVCTKDEKQGAVKMFSDYKTYILDIRNEESPGKLNDIIKKIVLTQDGDDRSDVLHPLATNRIEMIKESLKS